MVSMPVVVVGASRDAGRRGAASSELRSVFDTKAKVDRGPEGAEGTVQHAFEIETADRNLTLYSSDGDFVQLFIFYLKTMLEVKNECLK